MSDLAICLVLVASGFVLLGISGILDPDSFERLGDQRVGYIAPEVWRATVALVLGGLGMVCIAFPGVAAVAILLS
jgi:uncharacterized membrane protein